MEWNLSLNSYNTLKGWELGKHQVEVWTYCEGGSFDTLNLLSKHCIVRESITGLAGLNHQRVLHRNALKMTTWGGGNFGSETLFTACPQTSIVSVIYTAAHTAWQDTIGNDIHSQRSSQAIANIATQSQHACSILLAQIWWRRKSIVYSGVGEVVPAHAFFWFRGTPTFSHTLTLQKHLARCSCLTTQKWCVGSTVPRVLWEHRLTRGSGWAPCR